MKFSEIILADAIITDLKAGTKEDVVREMVQALSDAQGIPEQEVDSVVESIMRREDGASTGISHGVAVPHTKHASVERLVGAVAVNQGEGVDFDSVDCEKTNLFVMIVSPIDRPGEYLRALEHIMTLFKDSYLCRLKQAKNREEILELLEEADKES